MRWCQACRRECKCPERVTEHHVAVNLDIIDLHVLLRLDPGRPETADLFRRLETALGLLE